MSFNELFTYRLEYMQYVELLANVIPRCHNTTESITNFLRIISELKTSAENNEIKINIIKMVAMNRLSENMLTEFGEIVTYNDLVTELALYMTRHNLW